MSESITIRYATTIDNGLLAELGARTFYDSFAVDNTAENMAAYLAASFSPEKQADELTEPDSVFLLAEVERQVVGYARMREGIPPACIKGQRPIEIVRFYAVKEWIGHGVGAALMEACLNEAGKRGCDMIWLDVWERNPRGIAFYRKWGFEEVGRQTFKLGDDLQDDVLMGRYLNSAPNSEGEMIVTGVG
jgi:GNAT superfamily N-acetyltransferase